MTESARDKLHKEVIEKAKEYKSEHDATRAHDLMHAATLIRDFPDLQALSASFIRELKAMNLRQAERDAQDKKEYDEAHAKAVEADAKAAEEAAKKASVPKAGKIDVPELDGPTGDASPPPKAAVGAAASKR